MNGTENLNKIFSDVANAIRKKKGTADLINPSNFGAEINSIGEENDDETDSASKNAVTFYDYDGTVLHSYTKDKFLSLSAMPNLPERKGLICQGWNYNFEDAVAYVQEYGVLDVGATYITDDGKTRLYIRIAAEGRMDVPLYFSQSMSNSVVIDWGDGSETQTLNGSGNKNITHKYAEIGNYIITLDPISAPTLTLGLGHDNASNYSVMGPTSDVGLAYCNMLQKVELGRCVKSIGISAFNYCCSLESVTIPNSVTKIKDNAFYQCYSLASVAIPNSVTSIGGKVFYYCYSLASVAIPNSVKSIGISVFNYCYSLASVAIPNSVTSIGDNIFSNCVALASVAIPNSVTNIAGKMFQHCYSIASVAIPNSVTSIGSSAFYSCNSLAFCDISTHTTVPTLSATSTFNSIPSDCKIIVPDALYDEWIAATNWLTHASKIIKKTDWDASQA